MSLTDSPDPRKTLYFPKFDWPRVSNPKMTFPLDEAAVVKTETQSIAEIKSAISANPDDIAALIIEPIQGEGGDNYFREEFFRELRKICDENEIMLIYDEVQTGIGLTGKMWAHQHYGVDCRPDIVSFGKKTQICGIFVSNRVDEVAHNVFHESSRLNSTWGGNIADMVRFTLYLEVIEKEGLVDKAAENGKYVLDKLVSLQKYNGDVISNVRGKGLFCAFDLPNGDVRDKMVSHIADEGALMLGCGTKSIRFRPHLNITLDEIDTGFEMIERAIQKL
jgi:L-lysine 6-transaminase